MLQLDVDVLGETVSSNQLVELKCLKKWETIYLLSPIIVISLKAIDLSNRGWNVVTPPVRMLSIILAESEHLDNLGYTQLMQA